MLCVSLYAYVWHNEPNHCLCLSLPLSFQIIRRVGLSEGFLAVIVCMYFYLRVTNEEECFITKRKAKRRQAMKKEKSVTKQQ